MLTQLSSTGMSFSAVPLCIPVPPYKDTSQIGLGVTLTAHLFKPLQHISQSLWYWESAGVWRETQVQPITCLLKTFGFQARDVKRG